MTAAFPLAALVGLAMLAPAATAQTWPVKPIRVIVSYGPGGGADLLTRSIAPKMSERLGQPLVIDNRGGASGAIGADMVAKAAPDGYTILSGGNPEITMAPFMNSKLPYDPVRDLVPITLTAKAPSVLVINPALGVNTVRELIELSRTRPEGLSYGTPGVGGNPVHLAMEGIAAGSGAKLVHISYKGGGPATTDLIANVISVAAINAPPLMPHLRSGKLRALAVLDDTRSGLLPDVPTIREAAGIERGTSSAWFAMFAPHKTPPAIVARLEAAARDALADPEVKAKLAAIGLDAVGLPARELADRIKTDTATNGEAVKRYGIKPQ